MKFNLSIDWILTGEGPMKRGETQIQPQAEANPEKVEPCPFDGQVEPDFKMSEALAMTARVLESGTSYATALYLNIQHFERAVRAEEEIRQVKQNQRELVVKFNDMTDVISQMRQEIKQLKEENAAMREPKKKAVNQ